MGQHKHVRLCVNGRKDHSTGGDSYDYILRDIDKLDVTITDSHVCKLIRNIQSKPKYITFIFIRAHNCRHYRSIVRITTFKCDPDGKVTSRTIHPDQKVWYACTDPNYVKLSEINLFDSKTMLNRECIKNVN